MTTVHPRRVGNRMTVLVNYHGSDTYRFSNTEIDTVDRLDRFGNRRRYKSLARAMQAMFAVEGQCPVLILARWISGGSVVEWEAIHMAQRLRLEGVAGSDEIDLNRIDDLPKVLKARGIKVW